MLTKKKFVKYINTLKKHDENLKKLYNGLDVAFDGRPFYILDEGIISALIELLEKGMGDKCEWVSYFIYDLEFGSKYKPGCVTDENGTNINISTPEKLWEMLKIEKI